MTEDNKEVLDNPSEDKQELQEDSIIEERSIEEGNVVDLDQDVANLDPDQEEDKVSDETDQEIFAGISMKTFEELTKKNQQFIISLDRQVQGEMAEEVQQKVFQEIVETLLEGQAVSQTAKQIYGTPSELAQTIRDQALTKEKVQETQPSSDLLLGVDGSLFLGSLFTFVTGLSMLLAKEGADKQAYMGVITMILNYIVAGYAMLMTAKNLPNPDAEKGKKGYMRYFIVSIASMVVWFVVVSFSVVILPRAINPVLPGVVYMLIGAFTFIIRFYFRRKYNIKGGVF